MVIKLTQSKNRTTSGWCTDMNSVTWVGYQGILKCYSEGGEGCYKDLLNHLIRGWHRCHRGTVVQGQWHNRAFRTDLSHNVRGALWPSQSLAGGVSHVQVSVTSNPQNQPLYKKLKTVSEELYFPHKYKVNKLGDGADRKKGLSSCVARSDNPSPVTLYNWLSWVAVNKVNVTIQHL